MYFPYLRGRQFELIALRELIEKGLINEKVFPIIEPVKTSPTLTKTLNVFSQKEKPISVILNPLVGSLNYNKLHDADDTICKNIIEGCNNAKVTPSYHLRKELLEVNTRCNLENSIIVADNEDTLQVYDDIFIDKFPKFSLIKDESGFRRRIRRNRVILADRFKKKNRNTDYSDNIEEFFSSDHLFYKEDGYVGFSDYSIVGDEYVDGGFAPYAVAIHIVYFDDKSNLRIKHFVSDSNEDYTDTTKKFYEALKKLVEWNKTAKLDTYAIKEFEDMYNNPRYPGLGTVKKLAIMHHLELMNTFLNQESD